MHARDRQEGAVDVGKFAAFDIEHAAPLHARRRGVGALAGGRAGLAADAAPQVDHHGITLAHAAALAMRRTATRTISAPEPVASVSSSDIGAIVFRLARSVSLAKGVAQ